MAGLVPAIHGDPLREMLETRSDRNHFAAHAGVYARDKRGHDGRRRRYPIVTTTLPIALRSDSQSMASHALSSGKLSDT